MASSDEDSSSFTLISLDWEGTREASTEHDTQAPQPQGPSQTSAAASLTQMIPPAGSDHGSNLNIIWGSDRPQSSSPQSVSFTILPSPTQSLSSDISNPTFLSGDLAWSGEEPQQVEEDTPGAGSSGRLPQGEDYPSQTVPMYTTKEGKPSERHSVSKLIHSFEKVSMDDQSLPTAHPLPQSAPLTPDKHSRSVTDLSPRQSLEAGAGVSQQQRMQGPPPVAKKTVSLMDLHHRSQTGQDQKQKYQQSTYTHGTPSGPAPGARRTAAPSGAARGRSTNRQTTQAAHQRVMSPERGWDHRYPQDRQAAQSFHGNTGMRSGQQETSTQPSRWTSQHQEYVHGQQPVSSHSQAYMYPQGYYRMGTPPMTQGFPSQQYGNHTAAGPAQRFPATSPEQSFPSRQQWGQFPQLSASPSSAMLTRGPEVRGPGRGNMQRTEGDVSSRHQVQSSYALPRPQHSEHEPLRSTRDSKSITIVKVEGVNQTTDIDKLEMYFESRKRSGGGELTLDDQRSQGYVLLTFNDATVAKQVLDRTHVLDGVQLTVSPHRPPSTVKVSGLRSSVSKDLLRMYFETEKSGADSKVEEIILDTDKGEAFITFSDPEAVPKVLEKCHTIKDKTISVMLPSTPDLAVPASTSSSGTSIATATPRHLIGAVAFTPAPTAKPSQEPEPPSPTVEVRGLSKSTSKETLTYYFENKRRSGGGPVEEVDLNEEEGKAKVTFQSAEDATSVAAKEQHMVDGVTIDVRLSRPLQMMKNAFLLTNLPEVISNDELQNFIEAKTSLDIRTILFGEEEGTAVVTFDSDVDFITVKAAVTKRSFKKQKITVEQVPASNTVLLNNIPQDPPPTVDTITNYFENARRSGGGDVDKVQISDDGESATVTFIESEVAVRVAAREHILNNQPLSVRLFMECLGPSGGSEEPMLKIPEPIAIDAADSHKISLLQEVPAFRESLESFLKTHYAALDHAASALVCCLTLTVDGARQKARTWVRDVTEALQVFLHSLKVEEIAASHEVFVEAEERLRELAGGSEAGLHYDNHTGKLFIVCRTSPQSRHVYNDIKNAVCNAQEKVQRKEDEKNLKIEASRGKLQLLINDPVLMEIKQRFPELATQFKISMGFVELIGLEEEIQAAKQIIDSVMSTFTTLVHQWPGNLAELLQQIPDAENVIRTACMDQDADGSVELNPHGFEVHSNDHERAEVMQAAGVSAVQRWDIKLDCGKEGAVRLDAWGDLKKDVLERNKGRMLITEDQSGITIVGVGSAVNQDVMLLTTFLEVHSNKEVSHKMEKPVYELLRFYLQDKDEVPSEFVIDISFIEDETLVVIKGSKTEVENAEKALKIFQRKMVREERLFTEPSMEEYLKSDDWNKRQRQDIEQRLKCKILDPTTVTEVEGAVGGVASGGSGSVQTEGLLAQAVRAALADRGSSDGGAVSPSRPVSQIMPKVPLKPRIFMNSMSDITKEEHDVLVNSTNVHLKLSRGQVSSALLKVGGQQIQEECTRKYPNGITMGDIAVTGPGRQEGTTKLMCKNLFHCCLPEAKEAEAIKRVVKEAVQKCLAKTEALGHKSIGFPALGTGTLKYPPNIVAKVMYEAVLEYGKQNPNTQISDVIFILHKKPEDAPVREAFKAEDDQYKQLVRDSSQQAVQAAQRQSLRNPNAQGIRAYKHFARTEGRVKVKFLAYSRHAVDQAVRELLDCYKDKITSIYPEVPQLEEWEDIHVATLTQICSMMNVDLTFNYTLRRLELHGFRHNIDRVALHATMRDADEGVREKQNALLMAEQVQWSMVEIDLQGERLVPYEPRNNYLIENGYREGKLRVIVVHVIDNTNKSYNVDFTTFEEVPEDPNDTSPPLRIIRQDMLREMAPDAQLPSHWSDMRGQTLDCDPLRPNDREYLQVAESFTRSLNNPAVQIVKIQRVQNETLYKQYMARKQQMDRNLSGDRWSERDRLWHGTNEKAAEGIIKIGFNRSYSDLSRIVVWRLCV